MSEMAWLFESLPVLLGLLPSAVVWFVVLIVGGVLLMRRHTLPGGLLITASLLAGVTLVIGVLRPWAIWNLDFPIEHPLLYSTLNSVDAIIGFVALLLLLASVWAGRGAQDPA